MHRSNNVGLARLFDQLVGAQRERLKDRQAERLGSGQIDDEIELGRLSFGDLH
jgi:hypothetical protein